MKAATVRMLSIIAITTLFLTGCGQKGDLYHPLASNFSSDNQTTIIRE